MSTEELLLLIGVSVMVAAIVCGVVALLWHRIAKKHLNEKLNKEFGKRWG